MQNEKEIMLSYGMIMKLSLTTDRQSFWINV